MHALAVDHRRPGLPGLPERCGDDNVCDDSDKEKSPIAAISTFNRSSHSKSHRAIKSTLPTKYMLQKAVVKLEIPDVVVGTTDRETVKNLHWLCRAIN